MEAAKGLCKPEVAGSIPARSISESAAFNAFISAETSRNGEGEQQEELYRAVEGCAQFTAMLRRSSGYGRSNALPFGSVEFGHAVRARLTRSRAVYVDALRASALSDDDHIVVLRLAGTVLYLFTESPPTPEKPSIHLAPPLPGEYRRA